MIELKALRRIGIGPIVTVVFENRTTMRFQIQEMARAERMLTDDQIRGELEVYNALIPGPGELSMTLFIELTDEAQLREWLPRLVGIERAVQLHLGGRTVAASVDPSHETQLTREETTASVHYVRIALGPKERDSFATGPATIAIDHPNYCHEVELSEPTRASIVADW